MATVLIHVQHLMGIGHQSRAAHIARALQTLGLNVVYVSGGYPVPDLQLGGARLVQLPPAKALDFNYKQLIDLEGNAVDEAWQNARRAQLLGCFQDCSPDLVLIETFPFGRRLLTFELDPLLAAARQRAAPPLVFASIRDIIEPRDNPERYDEMAARVLRSFDKVLVHSDPERLREQAERWRDGGFPEVVGDPGPRIEGPSVLPRPPRSSAD